MPTKNPRINITFNSDTAGLLAEMAKHHHKSIADITRELVLESLDRREDRALSTLADSRAHEIHEETFSHDEAWK